MLTPDLDRARRFVAAHPPPDRLLLCGVTGAHLYGFPSPDSDVDLKAIHLAPTEAMLGLDRPPETHDVLTDFEGVEHDFTSHEAEKALSMLLRGNGNVLERILSPIQVVPSAEGDDLARLARGTISKRYSTHYRGFFGGVCREHRNADVPHAKSMLYSYRVALTGIHLLETGELEASLRALAPRYGFDEAIALADRKGATKEKVTLTPEDDARFSARWPELEAMLARAYAQSALPEEPENRDAVHAWLVETRLAAIGR